MREVLEELRRELFRAEGMVEVPDARGFAHRVDAKLRLLDRPSLRPVVNATGVVLHTNLGRAPLSEATRIAMARAAQGYSNLEYDLESGERGSRYAHCVDLLRELTGAPDALVVNNNAAAVVLSLNTLAEGRGVLVSRGELVEIGGGFRIPEMLSRSGAVLKEVGTTNRTRTEDYRKAASRGEAGAILKVHRSNFRISGFTEEAPLAELGDLAREMGLFLIHDLGSGLLADPESLGLPAEPRAPESLRLGAHVVAVSGDKLLGGPQAGILLGDRDVIGSMRQNPLCRAFRVDKVTLAGLEATLRHYLDADGVRREVPALRMLGAALPELEARALAVLRGLDPDPAPAAAGAGTVAQRGPLSVRLATGEGVVGGGTYPGVKLPSWTLRVSLAGRTPQDVAALLRGRDYPVIARVEADENVLDLRTVDPEEDGVILSALLELADRGT